METVKSAWKDFKSSFKPAMPPNIESFIKKAFYAGTVTALMQTMESVRGGKEMFDKTMISMNQEMKEYGAELEAENNNRDEW